MALDFICIGDATRDLFLFVDQAGVECNAGGEDCKLELGYGQKIPVEKIGWSLGGNAANVSVGLSRLGLSTGLMTIFGDDDRGAWIKKQLLLNNVDLTYSSVEPKRQSNLSAIIVFKGERTILTYHEPGEDLVAVIPPSKWIYITSSAGRDSAKIYGLVNNCPKEVKIAFNPSMADIKKGADYLKTILTRTEVLIVNWEEAETLLRAQSLKLKAGEKEKRAKEMLVSINKLGPKIVVVTNGPEGAFAMHNGRYFYEPAAPVPCFEATGAGDAFSSGLLAALDYGQKLAMALRWGTKNGGSVIQKAGAIEGLLDKNKISNS